MPELIETSPGESSFSSTWSPDIERSTSTSKRPGTSVLPEPEASPARCERIDNSPSVADSVTLPSAASIITPLSAWIALRVATAFETSCSSETSDCLEQES